MPSIETSGVMNVIVAIPIEDERRIRSIANFMLHQNLDASELFEFGKNMYKLGRETEAKRHESFMVGTMVDVEHVAILRAIECSDRNLVKAAKILGIGKTTLYRKVKELGIDYGQKARERETESED